MEDKKYIEDFQQIEIDKTTYRQQTILIIEIIIKNKIFLNKVDMTMDMEN